MENMNEIVKLAVDTYHGKTAKYSTNESLDTLRQAAIDLNGGSTKLDIRAIRDGKCNGLFTLIETILSKTIIDGIQGDEYFNTLVEIRNVAEGDSPVFMVEDSNLYAVAESAEGTLGIRRQRINGSSMVTVPTTFKVVRIYEELNRLLAGRSDFNKMIDTVSKSFQQQLLADTYTLWKNATAADFGSAYYSAAGNYNESTLLNIISHVEAASGKTATILGTKAALRTIAPAIQGHASLDDLYLNGFYGSFYGTPVVAIPQRHEVGTTNFLFDDKTLHIIAGDEKPIKLVYEGDGLMLTKDAVTNADLTQEYYYGEKYGMGLVLAGNNAGFGRYNFL